MKKALSSGIFLLLFIQLFGHFSLRVGDPRNSWYTYPGSIEEAVLTVEPKGLFMEYGLYLTFSSEGTPWTDVSDTLEVTLDFELPEDAVVFDSWLWIGEDIVRADILDRWTASLIYESIVNRRQDPSILTKQSSTQYELKVFPMAGNETRKVKISYLMPTSWNKQVVSAELPLGIFTQNNTVPSYFQVVTRVDQTWTNPLIVQDDALKFESLTDSLSGDYMHVAIPSQKFNNDLDIGFETPVKNGLYFSKYQNGTEGIYQVALFPADLLDTIAGSKVAILVDYDASNTHLTIPELLEITKNQMLAKLNPRDSFNLIFSNLAINRYSEEWVAATADNIEAAFVSLMDPLSSYSNLASLLANGIGFIRELGDEGQVVLLSDADQYDNFQVANTLISDIIALMDRQIPIHIADYQSTDFSEYYFENRYYRGNGYLNTNLSNLTGGSCQRVLDGYGINEAIGQSFLYSGGTIRSFDFHTSMDGGFCHSRHFVNGDGSLAYIHEAILQVGKFLGSFPFEIELSGEYNQLVFSKQLQVNAEDAVQVDTLAEEIWTGQYINKLESSQQSNDVINEIIYNSLTERVLSKYTSFLCLEPGFDPSDIVEERDDQWIAIPVEPQWVEDTLKVYPNPFTDYITIELQTDHPEEILELSIYNLSGSLLYRFDIEGMISGGSLKVTWDGTTADGNPVQSGMYLLVYRTTQVNKTIKIVKG